MYRLIIVVSLLAPGLLASTLSEVNRNCIADNSGETSNDFLVGKWYKVYRFAWSSMVPFTTCFDVTFSKPSPEELQEYNNKYNSAGFPFTLDENPILVNESNLYYGMYSGNTNAKYYVLDTKSSMVINEGYEVHVLRRIDDNYVLFWECSLRGNIRWLYARDKNAPQEEMLQIIASIPDVSRMSAQRYCSPV